eukprot:TRINITY_DN63773_c0_g1_i2.p1 TRINITY_DN63773_c0_g1~~TRINITY_DN63773_c0_g1_i2.p1  ORF type:complete len:307 (-),score=140.87 TRINITY_DN63773_c0_g1_i2:498-1418(-)
MKVVVAPNAFKECLSASAVGSSLARGVQSAAASMGRKAEVRVVPLADGGDGTMEIFAARDNATLVTVDGVQDPLHRRIKAQYVVLRGDGGGGGGGDGGGNGDGDENKSGDTAVIEMASASGLALLAVDEQDALKTTSFGFGQLIAHALRRGVRRFVLCIGGSATNDGGVGMAAALGYRFLDADGEAVDPVGGELVRVASVESCGAEMRTWLRESRIVVACDVDNPLLGARGATRVYGPQKGARTEQSLARLEAGLANVARLACSSLQPVHGVGGVPLSSLAAKAGAGAAGGMGFGLELFCVTECSR